MNAPVETESGSSLQTGSRPRAAAIAALSVPPLRSAGPNPELTAFALRARERRGPLDVSPCRGPFAARARDPVYAFHPYHTKVPPQVIQTLIEHYTRPGELVLDAFCGSGMTGVAARASGRDAILCDLAPGATFIAGVNTTAHDLPALTDLLTGIVNASAERWGWVYATDDGVDLNYAVWSDVFACPTCQAEFPFFPSGVEHLRIKVKTRKAFPCPAHCGASLSVRRVRRVMRQGEKARALVWINAGVGKRRINRAASAADLARAAEAASAPSAWFPQVAIDPTGYSARLAQLGDKGITCVSRFFSPRNLRVIADLWSRASQVDDPALRQACRAVLSSAFTVVSERQGYFGGGGGMSGNLYMPIVRMEKNVYAVVRRKIRKLVAVEAAKSAGRGEVLVSTQSATDLSAIPAESIDYVYTDPPFGANIIYSEMNLLLEAWLGVQTDPAQEAVIDLSRARGLGDYAGLLRAAFGEYHRVLKPGRWLTVEFHNTDPTVWGAIQEAIGAAGFEIQSVGRLDKGSSTILEDIRPSAARHDLLISATKPASTPRSFPGLDRTTPDAVWAAIEARLRSLPRDSADRSRHHLYAWMLAEQVAAARSVPLSSAEFLTGLRAKFREQDERFYAV